LEVHKLNDNAEDHRSWEVAGASAAEEIRPEAEKEEQFPQCSKWDADCKGKMEEENHWTSKPKPIRKCKNGETEEDDDEEEQELKVPSCETLRMCILTTLNWVSSLMGMQIPNDVVMMIACPGTSQRRWHRRCAAQRQPTRELLLFFQLMGLGFLPTNPTIQEPYFFWRILYDMTFYIVLIIIGNHIRKTIIWYKSDMGDG
jgi:hypothetical protein